MSAGPDCLNPSSRPKAGSTSEEPVAFFYGAEVEVQVPTYL